MSSDRLRGATCDARLLFALGVAAAATGCGDTVFLLTLEGAEGARRLQIDQVKGCQLRTGYSGPGARVDEAEVRLSGRSGEARLIIAALDEDGCKLAQGTLDVTLASLDPRPQRARVRLERFPEARCTVSVLVRGEGSVWAGDRECGRTPECPAPAPEAPRACGDFVRGEVVLRADPPDTARWFEPCAVDGPSCRQRIARPGEVRVAFSPGPCLPGGACQESPVSLGRRLNAVFGRGQSDIWATGDGGVLVRFDGQRWVHVTSGVKEDLYGIAARDERSLWVVGDRGVVLRYDEERHAFTREQAPVQETLRGVWADGRGASFVVGHGGRALRHEEGKGWSDVRANTTKDLYAVVGPGPGDGAGEIWVAGDRGTLLSYNGVELMPWPDALTTSAFTSLLWLGRGDVWAADAGGSCFFFDGGRWIHGPRMQGDYVRALAGHGGRALWATGNLGDLWRSDGAAWSVEASLGRRGLRAVWLDRAGQGLVSVGADGAIWQRIRQGQPFIGRGIAADLMDVWGGADGEMWAVGRLGTVLRRAAGPVEWRAEPVPSAASLRALYGEAGGALWAVGDRATVLRRGEDGAWVSLDVPAARGHDLLGAGGLGGGDFFVVGSGGLVLRRQGEGWSRSEVRGEDGMVHDLFAVFAAGEADVWAAGTEGALLHFDGSGWSAAQSGTTRHLLSLHGEGPGRVFAGGEGGVVLIYDGASWREDRRSDGGAAITALWAEGGRAWAASAGGALLRREQDRWVLVERMIGPLRRLRGKGGGLWAVGDGGQIWTWPAS